MNKRRLLYIVVGIFLFATLVLVAGEYPFKNSKISAAHSNNDDDPRLSLKAWAGTIALLKSKCGFETKIENEEACECDADIKLNLAVDEVEAIVRKFPELASEDLVFGGQPSISVKSLIESRRPLSSDCSSN